MAMFGIFFSIGLIMVLAFKGWSTIWVAPLAACIVALTGGLDLIGTYLGAYMQGFATFSRDFFPAFMLGAIFGKLMDSTLMAKSVALAISKLMGPRHAILAVIIAGSVLTYGGVSMFVAVFALFPICLVLFREANIPRRLIPASITVGVFAYTMVALPGTPQIQNIIPGQFFGTPATAAPVVGILSGLFMVVTSYFYLIWREKKVKAAGEQFSEPANVAPAEANEVVPNVWLSLLPLVLVVALLNILNRVVGWEIMPALIFSLVVSILLILILNIAKRKTFINTLNEGAKGAMIPIINVSAIVGFGMVVRASPAFQVLVDMLINIPGNPLVSLAIAVNVMCGATGSASGGLGIALTAISDAYINLASQYNIPLEVMHRVAAISASALDTVPHNGAILTLLAVTGMTHKESYGDIAVCTIVIPVVGTAVAILFAVIGLV
jgi:H+/gluconate symporter-like permease